MNCGRFPTSRLHVRNSPVREAIRTGLDYWQVGRLLLRRAHRVIQPQHFNQQ